MPEPHGWLEDSIQPAYYVVKGKEFPIRYPAANVVEALDLARRLRADGMAGSLFVVCIVGELTQ